MQPYSQTADPPFDEGSVEQLVGRTAGQYLTAIYWHEAVDDGPVSTGEIGTYLGGTPASVTEMFMKLAADEFVEYEKHRGVTLIRSGSSIGKGLAWRQCVVRTFFAAKLNTEIDRDVAYEIGFTLPAHGIDKLREFIDHSCEGVCQVTVQASEYCPFGTQAEG